MRRRQLLSAHGAQNFYLARRVDRLKKVAAESLKVGAPEAQYHFLDVAKTKSVEEFISWVQKKIDMRKNLHVLINNAGGAHGLDTITEGKDADLEAMIQSNVLGVLRVTRATLPLMPRDAGAESP